MYRLTLRLNKGMQKALQKRAKRQGATMAEYARALLYKGIVVEDQLDRCTEDNVLFSLLRYNAKLTCEALFLTRLLAKDFTREDPDALQDYMARAKARAQEKIQDEGTVEGVEFDLQQRQQPKRALMELPILGQAPALPRSR